MSFVRQAKVGNVLLAGLVVLAHVGWRTWAADARVSVLTGAQVIQILDDTVEWYRALGTQQQNATQPSDLLILYANRQTADKVVKLVFDIARANAELLSSEASSATAGTTPAQSLTQEQTQLATDRQGIQQEMATDKKKLAAAGKDRPQIQAKLSELQGELAMVDARRNLLDTMTKFVNGTDPKTASVNAVKSQIDAIAATVPAATAAESPARTAGPGAGGTPLRSGIWDLAAEVLHQHAKLGTIRAIDQRTTALASTFHNIAQLQGYSGRSNDLATQADHAESGALKDLRNEATGTSRPRCAGSRQQRRCGG